MKHLKLSTVILLIFILALFNGCENSKSSSILGNAEITSIIEKLPQYLFNPTSLNKIFLEDAVLTAIHHSMHKTEYKGIKEIATFHSNQGSDWNNIKAVPKKIKVVNTQADVDFTISYDVGKPGQQMPWECKGTAKLVKKGSNWIIKEITIEGI